VRERRGGGERRGLWEDGRGGSEGEEGEEGRGVRQWGIKERR
jgi:hypothetical protein